MTRTCYTPSSSGGDTPPVGDHKSFLGISTVPFGEQGFPTVGNSHIENPDSGEWVAVQGSSEEYYWDGYEWKPFGDENAEGREITWNDDDVNS